MRKAQLHGFGNPADSVSLIDVDEPAAPTGTQVLVRIDAASINPAELLMIQGKYASKPPLPAPLGFEGAGEVLAVGPQVIALPADIDIEQAGMLKVNPATALLMLREFKTLRAGDWVIQNAANSGVGHNLVQLAHAQGIKTVCVVRRESVAAELKAIGATEVLVDGPDLVERVRARVDGALPLAIDAIGGEATCRLAGCLDDGGAVVNYGLLSGQNCQVSAEQLIFRSISLHGFWLTKELRSMPGPDVQALYDELSASVAAGKLRVPVEKVYPLRDIAAALDHAMSEGRSGKILLRPSA